MSTVVTERSRASAKVLTSLHVRLRTSVIRLLARLCVGHIVVLGAWDFPQLCLLSGFRFCELTRLAFDSSGIGFCAKHNTQLPSGFAW